MDPFLPILTQYVQVWTRYALLTVFSCVGTPGILMERNPDISVVQRLNTKF